MYGHYNYYYKISKDTIAKELSTTTCNNLTMYGNSNISVTIIGRNVLLIFRGF